MAIESREKTIGDFTYRVAQLPTKRGQAMLVQLVKLLGPGMGSFVGGVGRSGASEADSALAVGFGEAVHELAMRLNEREVEQILTEFAKQTTVVVSSEIELRLHEVYDDHFAGRYDELLQWARFCLEVNYRSFFGGSSGANLLGRLWKMAQAYQSRATSTGTSTASQPAHATPQA